jgi:hypothetical protein
MLRISAVFALLAVLSLGCTSVPEPQPTPGGPGQTGAVTQAPGATQAATPGAPATQAPGGTTAPGGSSAICALTNANELGSILGGTWDQTDDSDGCTWMNTAQLSSLTARFEQGSDFTGPQLILSNAEQVTVANHPAIIGDFVGPLLYVQVQSNQQFVLQGVLMDTNATTHQQLIDLATAMIGRM